MEAWLVISEEGEYDDYEWSVIGIYSSRELADKKILECKEKVRGDKSILWDVPSFSIRMYEMDKDAELQKPNYGLSDKEWEERKPRNYKKLAV